MIPEGRLSTETMYAPFQEPDDREDESALIDYELGGRSLNDPSEGLQVHVWRCEVLETGEVNLVAPGEFETTIFTAPGTTEMRFCFDQNMRPFFTYTQDGTPKFRWYNTELGSNVIDTLPAGTHSMRCTLDDKGPMPTSQGTSDIILAYIRDGALYYRQQRDRYENEYLLAASLPGGTVMKRFGMNQIRRLQFEFE